MLIILELITLTHCLNIYQDNICSVETTLGCLHNGTCIEIRTAYKPINICLCTPEYTGSRCETSYLDQLNLDALTIETNHSYSLYLLYINIGYITIFVIYTLWLILKQIHILTKNLKNPFI